VPPLTVRIGVENPYDSSTYLQREGDPKVYSVDGTTRSSLDKGTFDLRDRDVLAVRDLGITRIEVHAKKHDWAVGRDPGQPYAFVRPVKEEADTTAISSWLGTLRSAKATRYLEDTPAERKRTGVETPLVDATFSRGATETVRVRLAAGKADSDPVYALREDQYGSALAEVPRSALAALDKSPAELRDRTMLHARPEDVTAIRIGSGDGALVLERERPTDGGPESWQLRSPRRGPPTTSRPPRCSTASPRSAPSRPRSGSPRTRGPPAWVPRRGAIVLEGQGGKALGSIALGAASKKPAGTFARDDRRPGRGGGQRHG
jgi:hypothetical protein